MTHIAHGPMSGTTEAAAAFLPEPIQSALFAVGRDTPRKRKRLNFACNYCRNRKTRCDEKIPSCQACVDAGVPCVTQDRRKPDRPIKRREAGTLARIDVGDHQTPGVEQHLSFDEPEVQVRSHCEASNEGTEKDAGSSPRGVAPAEDAFTGSEPSRFTGALPMLRQTSGTTSLEMLTEWLDLACYRLGQPQRLRQKHMNIQVTVPSRHVLDFTSASVLSQLSTQFPAIPEPFDCENFIERYWQFFNIVFPMIDESEQIRHDIARLISSGPGLYVQANGMLPLLRLCLILAAGAVSCDATEEHRGFVNECIKLGRSSLGHMIGVVTLEAVQTLFLLSLCLKYSDEISSATAVIDLCVSAATTMGLNKFKPSSARHKLSSSGPANKDSQHRTWLSIYCYEKLLSFEIGRPSSINDDESRNLLNLPDLSEKDSNAEKLTLVILSLAKILSEIGERCVTARRSEEDADRKRLESVIENKVKATGESCLRLMDWADSLPSNLRPTSDLLWGSKDILARAFVSVQYNNALIILMRNSLLISPEALRLSVSRVAQGKPWEAVIRNGQSLVGHAARRVIRLFIEIEDQGETNYFLTYSAPLHAMFILIAHSLSRMEARVVRTDTELVSEAVYFVKKISKSLRCPDEVDALLKTARSLMVKSPTPASIKSQVSTQNRLPTIAPSPVEEQDTRLPTAGPSSESCANMTPNIIMDSSFDEFGWSPSLPDEIGCDWAEFARFCIQMNGSSL